MKTFAKKRIEPRIVLDENGEPSAVILNIGEYEEMLERLEDIEDLKILNRLRKRPLRFRRFEEFLAEYHRSA